MLLAVRALSGLNDICCLANEIDNATSTRVSLQRRVNHTSCFVVLACFGVALQVLQDRGSIEEQIWVRLLKVFFGLSVGLQGELQLFNAF